MKFYYPKAPKKGGSLKTQVLKKYPKFTHTYSHKRLNKQEPSPLQMGLGCRVVAVIALATLLSFEVISLIAVGKDEQLESIDGGFKNVPVHRRKRSSDQDPEQAFDIRNKLTTEKSFSILKAKTWDSSSVNTIPSNGKDTFYTYTSKAGTRLKIKFSDFNIEENEYDYITAYSGELAENIENSEQALENLKSRDLKFLFSSKSLTDLDSSSSSKYMIDRWFMADANNMTLHFRHGSQSGPHEGHFEAKVMIDEFDKSTNGKRGLSSASLPDADGDLGANNQKDLRSFGKSFYICDENDPTNEVISNSGVVTSHQDFPNSKITGENLNSRCKKTIKSANNQNIIITIKELNIIDNSSINRKCDESQGHIRITDLVNNQFETYCYHDQRNNDLVLEFGSEIEIDFFTGEWPTAGFTLEYLAEAAAVMATVPVGSSKPIDNEDEQKNKLSNKKQKDDQMAEKENQNPVQINNDSDFIPFDLDEFYEYDEISTQAPKTQANSESTQNKENKNKKPTESRQFSAILVKVTMIAVGLILIVILISAGFIACHKTKEQDHYIKVLTEKLDQYENNKNLLESAQIINGMNSQSGVVVSPQGDRQGQVHVVDMTHRNGQNLKHDMNLDSVNNKIKLPEINIENVDETRPLTDEIRAVNADNRCYNGDSSSS